MYQQSIPVEYGDEVTVTVYEQSEAIYLELAEEGKPTIRFVRMDANHAKEVRKALKRALEKLDAV